MKAQRGAVIVETALTVGVGLTILLFAVQLGALGFLQITADGAAFVDARYHALAQPSPGYTPTPTATYEAQTAAIFPQIHPADIIAGSPSPAPSVTLPVNYGYAGGKRHGGVSMLQPEQFASVVTPHSTFIDNAQQVLGAAAIDVEPLWVECAPQFNVANSTAQCGASNQPANFAVNYFNQGENTPPYYVGFNFMRHCKTATALWKTCGSGNANFISLGVAEILDVDNWGAPNNGASGTGKSGSQPYSTFEWMSCHQRVYSALAQFFNTYSTYSSLYNTYQTNIQTGSGLGASPLITDFSTWNEFNTASPASPSANDLAIRQVYAWDAKGIATGTQLNSAPQSIGATGSKPLNPGNGC